jgi:hypothetical protein
LQQGPCPRAQEEVAPKSTRQRRISGLDTGVAAASFAVGWNERSLSVVRNRLSLGNGSSGGARELSS